MKLITETFDNGNIKSEKFINDKNKKEYYKEYYENGNIKSETYYEHYEEIEKYKEYYENGNIKINNYEDDSFVKETYYINGKMKSYKFDLIDGGLFVKYYDTGDIKSYYYSDFNTVEEFYERDKEIKFLNEERNKLFKKFFDINKDNLNWCVKLSLKFSKNKRLIFMKKYNQDENYVETIECYLWYNNGIKVLL